MLSRRVVMLALTVAVLVLMLAFAGSASAAEDSTTADVTDLTNADVSAVADAVVPLGIIEDYLGGTWEHGISQAYPMCTAYSEYMHHGRRHYARARAGSDIRRVSKPADFWAKTGTAKGFIYEGAPSVGAGWGY